MTDNYEPHLRIICIHCGLLNHVILLPVSYDTILKMTSIQYNQDHMEHYRLYS